MVPTSASFRSRISAAVIGLIALATIATACGESSDDVGGLRLVSVEHGAGMVADPPPDLVILDVRTPEEFAEGHIEGAVMLDFYESDFAAKLGDLDPDVPYLLYCQSGNRSGQTLTIMERLGFGNVADLDGGILNWMSTGQPVTAG